MHTEQLTANPIHVKPIYNSMCMHDSLTAEIV